MLGIDGEHQAVEKAAPLRRGIEKQPVHGRGEPGDGDEVGERRQAALRLAHDLEPAALARRVAAGGDVDRSVGGRNLGVETKGLRRAVLIEAVQAGAAQTAPRCQERQRLEQVRLAGAVGAVQHDRARPWPSTSSSAPRLRKARSRSR